MATEEIIYLTYDNELNRILTKDGVAQDLSGITKIEAIFGEGGTVIESNNGPSDPIRWAQGGYATGEIRCNFNGQSITAGIYTVYIVVYDAVFDDGLVWDSFSAEVRNVGT